MRVSIRFYSYLKDMAGCAQTTETLRDGSTLGELYEKLVARFPRMNGLRKSTLLAVGVEYQPREHVLRDGDEVSLFPPVQGG
jgi:sulfur-carrier protein